MTFAEGARRLAGAVPRVLGWHPGDFWDATPAELAAIFDTPGETGAASLRRDELTALMERDRHG